MTAVLDSNGFGGISVCSHRDKYDFDSGTQNALEYRDRAVRYFDKSGAKVIMAKNQDFPSKAVRQQILDYVENSSDVNTIDFSPSSFTTPKLEKTMATKKKNPAVKPTKPEKAGTPAKKKTTPKKGK